MPVQESLETYWMHHVSLTRHLNQKPELAVLLWREDRMIVKMSLKDRFGTATSISCVFCEPTGKPISRETVYPRLNKEKLVSRIPCRKPFIQKIYQKVRLDFASEYILWTEEQWNMVPFSDGSKFDLFRSDGKM